ncbi:hypothetical protein RRG08_032223 [Elysia crispata]|uniref:Uncharacterized protein n=1 Tax=Elysia crispata TaxID=231223 RepID=A0AAE1B1R2_9GAST|nr:hypothetical protein RRG08_032223 [Elysia crispata]
MPNFRRGENLYDGQMSFITQICNPILQKAKSPQNCRYVLNVDAFDLASKLNGFYAPCDREIALCASYGRYGARLADDSA